ncbi:hypothetical protein TKK_0017254 [Trichogramma kaykai]
MNLLSFTSCCSLLLLAWHTNHCSSSQQDDDWHTSDRVIFPEQFNYLLWHQRVCHNTSLILWGDGACYEISTQGPCNVGKIVLFDQKLLRPYCKVVMDFSEYDNQASAVPVEPSEPVQNATASSQAPR